MSTTINIAADYTPFPGGRYIEDGEGNGTTFRRDFLVPALASPRDEKTIVVLDGAAGYPSSFLEEAFGGLVRVEGYKPDVILNTFLFKADQPGFKRFIPQIEDYIRNARPPASR